MKPAPRVCCSVWPRLAAEHGRDAVKVELDLAFHHGVGLEGVGRIRHLLRIGQHAKLALVADGQVLEGLHHIERHPAAVHGLVVVPLRPLEHEPDAAIGQVDAAGHLAAAFVGPVGQPEPAAGTALAVEHVEVHALVEILRFLDGVQVLVRRLEAHADARLICHRHFPLF
jgi:hypothetical protein